MHPNHLEASNPRDVMPVHHPLPAEPESIPEAAGGGSVRPDGRPPEFSNSSYLRNALDLRAAKQTRSGSTAREIASDRNGVPPLQHTSPQPHITLSTTNGSHTLHSTPKEPPLTQSAPLSNPSTNPSAYIPREQGASPRKPNCHLPALWSVKAGGKRPDVTELIFDVKVEAADAVRHWAQRHQSFKYVHDSHLFNTRPY